MMVRVDVCVILQGKFGQGYLGFAFFFFFFNLRNYTQSQDKLKNIIEVSM